MFSGAGVSRFGTADGPGLRAAGRGYVSTFITRARRTTFARVPELSTILIASLGVLFIGISKAGFGGGLGILTTPICVLAFGAEGRAPTFAVGTLLPLLCAGDAFSLWHYWGKWEPKNLKYLLPGVVVGVIVGVQLMDHFSPRQTNFAIGVLALSFVTFQLVKERLFRAEGAFAPNHAIGIPCGIGAGITSTFAHGAGPLVSVFLIHNGCPRKSSSARRCSSSPASTGSRCRSSSRRASSRGRRC